jgi:hypothetical protein
MANEFVSSRALQMLGRLALGIGLLCLSTSCQAENKCPWLNEATASGLLGGDAVGAFVDASSGQPAVCAFTQTGDRFTRTLRISVEVVPEPHARYIAAAQACGSDAAPLQAIGNEATICAADKSKGVLGERVVGRVRDQIFTILIVSTLKADPVLTREALQFKLSTAAEQVAGNLF